MQNSRENVVRASFVRGSCDPHKLCVDCGQTKAGLIDGIDKHHNLPYFSLRGAPSCTMTIPDPVYRSIGLPPRGDCFSVFKPHGYAMEAVRFSLSLGEDRSCHVRYLRDTLHMRKRRRQVHLATSSLLSRLRYILAPGIHAIFSLYK